MDLIILTKCCEVYLTFHMRFIISFDLFTPFDTFLFQCYLKNVFETSSKLNQIWLKN